MLPAKIFNKLASPLLYLSGAYARRWQRNARQEPYTVVLAYHRVVKDETVQAGHFDIERGVPDSVFERQIRFMLRHFVPVKASQVLEPSSARLRFAVTLDDGYEDNFLVAAPILHRLGVPATFFVVSDYAGTDRLFWWEQIADMVRTTRVPMLDFQATAPDLLNSHRLPPSLPLRTEAEREIAYERLCAAVRAQPHKELPRYLDNLTQALEVSPREEGRAYALMNWAQLKELVRQGFEIGGHTASHANIVGADREMLDTEVVSSISAIERQLGVPVPTFAYPYGHFPEFNGSATNALKAAGCLAAFTGVNGVVNGRCDAFRLPRSRLNRRYNFVWAYNVQDAQNRSQRKS